jgi:hypothetical protein
MYAKGGASARFQQGKQRENKIQREKEKKKEIPSLHVTAPDCSAAAVLAEVGRIKMNQESGR